jgi:hypothetical protein
VQVYDTSTHTPKYSFDAYDPRFTGGVRVAISGIVGGVSPVIVTAPGPGGGPDIHVYDAATGNLIRQFWAFDPNFTGGVDVAVGQLDGYADPICGADAGGGPNVTVFSGNDGSRILSFFPFDPHFTGGVRVAAGDMDGSGVAEDIICGAGPGGGPNVVVYNGFNNTIMYNFFAFDPRFTGGVYVASTDVNKDGYGDILVGAGAGGGPEVEAFSGKDMSLLTSFFAAAMDFTGGVPLAAMQISQTQSVPALVFGPSITGGPIELVDPLSQATIDTIPVQSPGGLYIAANPIIF